MSFSEQMHLLTEWQKLLEFQHYFCTISVSWNSDSAEEADEGDRLAGLHCLLFSLVFLKAVYLLRSLLSHSGKPFIFSNIIQMLLCTWHKLWIDCIKEFKKLEFKSLENFASCNKIGALRRESWGGIQWILCLACIQDSCIETMQHWPRMQLSKTFTAGKVWSSLYV